MPWSSLQSFDSVWKALVLLHSAASEGQSGDINIDTQIGQVVATLFATELFHVHFCAKSSGIQGRVKFEISTHFSVPKWKK